MSSKTVDKTEKGSSAHWITGSLAARMTLWYSFSAFLLVLTATGLLYRGLSNGLAHEDDVLLSQNIETLRPLIQKPKSEEEIKEFEQELASEQLAHHSVWIWLRILDGSGKVMAETPDMSKTIPVQLFPLSSEKNGDSFRSQRVVSNQGRPFRVLAVQSVWPGHVPPTAILQVAVDMSSDEAILAKFRERLWLVLGFSLMGCALIGYWTAHRGIRPVWEMARTAKRIHSATLHERLETTGLPLELADLASTFNDMLNRLEDSFRRLSQFSTDIAHELRTPIQNLRGEMEVALSKPRPPQEYQDLLGSCLEEYQKLSTLIDRMLFLARADNPGTHINREPVKVGNELSLLKDFYDISASESGIAIEIISPPEMTVPMDRALFQRAVGNLLENALKNTPRGGRVVLTAALEKNTARIEVADTGRGIPEDQLSNVFDRFYRVDPSRSPALGGSGLGLAIVKSIMTLHGGSVEIQSRLSEGTRVSLVFPLS